MQMLKKRSDSPDRGAPPQSMNRRRPPSTDRMFLKIRTFQNNLSSPQAPSQLPSKAANWRLYAMWKSFFTKPPFSST